MRRLAHHIGRMNSAELLLMTTVSHGLLLRRRWRRGMMIDHVHSSWSVLMMHWIGGLLLKLDMMLMLLTITAMHGRGANSAGGRLNHVRRRRLTAAHHSHSTLASGLLMTDSSPTTRRSVIRDTAVHMRRRRLLLLIVSATSVHCVALSS